MLERIRRMVIHLCYFPKQVSAAGTTQIWGFDGWLDDDDDDDHDDVFFWFKRIMECENIRRNHLVQGRIWWYLGMVISIMIGWDWLCESGFGILLLAIVKLLLITYR